jgi:HAD superfamily hydrolase (TIGR01509 family)
MIRAIFWDNDGVLVDTEHLYFEATQQVLGQAGIALTEDDYVELFLRQGRGAWHLAEERGVAPGEIDRLRQERNMLYAHLLDQAPRLIDGVIEVLETLRGKYVMGVVTSSRKDHFDVIHRSTGVLKYFDFVLTASDYPRTKPAPDPYLAAVERSGMNPGDCIAVEDSERGLEAAGLAGIRCLIVPSRLTRQCAFPGALRILTSVRDVPLAL